MSTQTDENVLEAIRLLGTATASEIAVRSGYARSYLNKVLPRLLASGATLRTVLIRDGRPVLAYEIRQPEAAQ